MDYCPNCGAEVGNSVNFCSDCGERLQTETTDGAAGEAEYNTVETQRTSRSSTDRIQLDTGPGTDRIYNLENISYFQALKNEYSLLAKAGFALFVVLAFLGWVVSESEAIIVGSLVLVLVVWSVFNPDDGLAIGTLADRDEIDTDDPDAVEADFLEKTSGQISISGTISSSLYELGYTYHFLKKNIISIERFESMNKLWPTLALLLGVSGLGVVYTWVNSDPTVADANRAITVGLISHLVLCVGTAYFFYGVYPTLSYFSQSQIVAYHLSGLLIFVSLPGWFLIRDELNEFSSLIASGAVGEIQILSILLTVLSISLIAFILYLPPPGVLISLPSDEQVPFSMTDKDVMRVLREFRE